MPPKAYPDLPESPQQQPSKSEAVVVEQAQTEDLPKYNIVRAATGTGVISSVLTLSTVNAIWIHSFVLLILLSYLAYSAEWDSVLPLLPELSPHQSVLKHDV